MSNFYITTSIPYVNGEPHLGHAMEFLMADVLARRARQTGDAVIYTIGTDEHGGKIAEKAAEKGLSPKAMADEMSATFSALAERLNVSNDRFIRTTDEGHEQRAKLIWKALKKDIYRSQWNKYYSSASSVMFVEI